MNNRLDKQRSTAAVDTTRYIGIANGRACVHCAVAASVSAVRNEVAGVGEDLALRIGFIHLLPNARECYSHRGG